MVRILSKVIFAFLSFQAFAQPGGGVPPPGAPSGPNLFVEAAISGGGRAVQVAGRLSPSRTLIITAPINGTVGRIALGTGARVGSNQQLLSIFRSEAGESFRPVPIESRINGVISRIHVQEGQEVSNGQALVTVLDVLTYELRTALSDRDSLEVRQRLGSVLVLKDSEGAEYRGRIKTLSEEPDYETGGIDC